jgi:anti-sigma regulatory factor (Ser/Thr protein kinase)
VISTLIVESDPLSVRQARQFVAGHLDAYDERVVDSATLMVSELVTNSIRHAAGPCTIRLEITADAVRVEVSDRGQGTPVLQSPTPDETSGRGLRIVAALADDWGASSVAPHGSMVWFCMNLHAPGELIQRARAFEQSVNLHKND